MGQRLIQVPRPLGEAREPISDRSEDAEAMADKQRRRIQNRKNQRTHRKSVLAAIDLSVTVLTNLCRTAAQGQRRGSRPEAASIRDQTLAS